jgi:hypothetical protein
VPFGARHGGHESTTHTEGDGVNWIAVRTHLSSAKVAQRLAPLCKGGAQHAAGVLQDFWSSVSEHASNGYIGDANDSMLESWARWEGKRGAFAKWVREFHMDEHGRVNEWDNFMGELEARREKARLKKQRQRSARRGHEGDNGRDNGGDNTGPVPPDVPGPVPGDVSGVSPPTVRDVTQRDVTQRNETQETEKRSSTAARDVFDPTWPDDDGRRLLFNELGPTQRKAMRASLAVWAKGYELPNDAPKRKPTDAELSRACREAASSVQAGQISANLVRTFLARVMRGDPDRPEDHRSRTRVRTGAAGWDDVK